MISFSQEVFLALFAQYNQAVWPAQLVAYLLGIATLLLLFRPSRWATRLIGIILAAFWLWNAIAYHWLTFTPINFAAPVFAIFFVIASILFLWSFVVRAASRFVFRRDIFGWTGLAIIVFAMAGYPLVAALVGHRWPNTAMFGIAPCQTVIFTLGLLLMAEPRVPWSSLVIPLLWTVVGGSAAWFLAVPEDFSLPLAGIMVLGLVTLKNRRAT